MKSIGFLGFLLVVLTLNVTAELPTWDTLVDRARWAANAHNVQSWVLDSIPGRPDQRKLTLSPARLLPQTDPPSRQLTISLGTFLAVLEDEAAAQGAQITWQPLVDGAGALVTLSVGTLVPHPQGWVDALTSPTVKYRTSPQAFSPKVLATWTSQSNEVVRFRWLTDPSEVVAAKDWAKVSFHLEMELPRTRNESILYTQYGADNRRSHPYGITLLPNFPQSELFWIEGFANLFPQSPAEYTKSAEQMFDKALVPVTQILVVVSTGDGLRDRIATGEALQRVWVDVRTQGGELLPLSQGLEEFPEMAGPYAEARQRWATGGQTVQMVLALFRPGPGVFLPSPRLPVSAILK